MCIRDRHLLIHSGSRAAGQAILAKYLPETERDPNSKVRFLQADSEHGQAYLSDLEWARAYAAANRKQMLKALDSAISPFGLRVDFDSVIDVDHNHVQRETHDGQSLFVHRKGSQRVDTETTSIVPGSMGEPSFVVSGRGCAEAMFSCAHGAGRRMARKEAANRISVKELRRQMRNVCYDETKAKRLLDEAPAAYKEIGSVMKAQKKLVKIEQRRMPVLNFKAG